LSSGCKSKRNKPLLATKTKEPKVSKNKPAINDRTLKKMKRCQYLLEKETMTK